MAMCTVDNVKALIHTDTVTDAEITAIIASVSEDIAIEVGASSSSTDSTLVRACVHSSAAMLLHRMKYTGEMAQQRQIGDSMRSNSITAEIGYHQEKAKYYINKYINDTNTDGWIISGRIGYGTVNNEVLYDY